MSKVAKLCLPVCQALDNVHICSHKPNLRIHDSTQYNFPISSVLALVRNLTHTTETLCTIPRKMFHLRLLYLDRLILYFCYPIILPFYMSEIRDLTIIRIQNLIKNNSQVCQLLYLINSQSSFLKHTT